MIFAWLTGALAAPPCPLPTGEHVVTLGIASHGHSFGGLGVVEFEGADWSLTALSPAGPAVFTVTHTSAGTTVESAFPEWTPLLAKLPFDRDLLLLNTVTETTCHSGDSRIVITPTRRLWRGAPGPARVVTTEGRSVLSDPLRGYTLTIVEAAPIVEATP